MHDDNLQGILFSKAELIDLSPYKRHERVAKIMNQKKRSIIAWRERQQGQIKLKRAILVNSDGIIPLTKRKQSQSTAALASRLKVRD